MRSMDVFIYRRDIHRVYQKPLYHLGHEGEIHQDPKSNQNE